jgi:hypothetical protein
MEVNDSNTRTFESICKKYNMSPIPLGTTGGDELIFMEKNKEVASLKLSEAQKIWHESLRSKIFS